MKNITTQKIVEILHQIENDSLQLSFIPPAFPYYHPTNRANIFYKIGSKVDNDYQTKGEISIALIERKPRSKREKIILQVVNTRHCRGIARRIRQKIKEIQKEYKKFLW